MYVIQYKLYPWDKKWITGSTRYPTLQEAQAIYDTLSFKTDYRIAEEYTVVRYKPVK